MKYKMCIALYSQSTLSKIATPLKQKKRLYIGQFELLLYTIYCNSYFSKVIMVDKHGL